MTVQPLTLPMRHDTQGHSLCVAVGLLAHALQDHVINLHRQRAGATRLTHIQRQSLGHLGSPKVAVVLVFLTFPPSLSIDDVHVCAIWRYT